MNRIKTNLIICVLLMSLPVQAVEYRLAMSRSDDLCGSVEKFYGGATNKSGDFRFKNVNVFYEIDWKNIEVTMSDFESEYAVFDIDNDGEKDIVVRVAYLLGGVLAQDLLIYNENEIDIKSGYYLENYKAAKRKISMRYMMYSLDGFNERPEDYPDEYYVMRIVNISPFIYRGKAYVSFHDYLSEKNKNWILISEYTGGVVDGRFKDKITNNLVEKCYFEKVK